MSAHVVGRVRAGVAHEFMPDGDGTWRLVLRGPRGDQPGGVWTSTEVARQAVYAIFDTEPTSANPLGGGK
ncbi:MAG: hypothetical protein QOH72_1496 [Solirubrobacteraceae bacterium]|nr:hypothetical protein [Solirubrobacteraceae bacterium]